MTRALGFLRRHLDHFAKQQPHVHTHFHTQVRTSMDFPIVSAPVYLG